ncbi:MAG TPA: hypothetical protein V6C72_03690, partial [Chroococcales cyanobacterium]
MLAIESSSAQEQCRAPACTNSVASPALTSMVVPPAAQQDDSIYGRISELFPINRQGHVIDSWLQWQRRNPGCMLVATVPLGRNSLHLLELEQGNNESLEEYIDLAWHMVAASLRKALISLQPSEECANQDAVLRAYQKVVSAMSSVPGADFNFELKLEDKSDANERLSCVQYEDMNVAIGRLFVSAGIASEHDVRLIGHCASINRVTLTEMATILLGISVNLARGIEQISAEVVHGRISFYQGVVAVNHS